MSKMFDVFDFEEVEVLKALIDKMEASSFDYLKIEGKGLNITIGKNGFEDQPAAAAPAAPVAAVVPAAAPAAAPVEAAPVEEAPAAVEAAPVVEEAPAAAPAGDVEYILCPSYGLFYAQSEPGAPPYVKVGDHLNAGDTVGLLEIMKTYTAITTDVAGVVTEILVKNQDAVEPDQPLFAIKAD